MQIKTLLIFPPISSGDKGINDIAYPPIGMACISSFLKSKGYEVELVDMFDFKWEAVKDFFHKNSVDLIGITCWTGTHFNSFRLAELAKKYMRNNPLVVLGGPHATTRDLEIMNFNPSVDIIVRGEGELSIHEILKYKEGKINLTGILGITYRDKDGHIVRNPDRDLIENLDSLPFPDNDNLELHRYRDYLFSGDPRILERPENKKCKDILFTNIFTSRGCPNRCQFCYSIWPKWRFRSAENVVEEIDYLYRKGIRYFAFVDDTFTLPLERTQRICELIIEKKLKISWRAYTRAWPISENVVKLMKDAGCQRIGIGVESGSEKILSTIRKGITVDQIRQAYKIFNKIGIPAYALLMVGNPGETVGTIRQTIQLIRECDPKGIIVSPTIIFPNTELYRLAVEQKLIKEDFWVRNGSIPCYTAEHSFNKLRYFRFKILLHYYIQIGKVGLILKYLILTVGMYILSALRLGKKNK